MAPRIIKAIRAGSQTKPARAEQLLGSSCSEIFSCPSFFKGLICRSNPRRQTSELDVPVDATAYEKPRDTILFPPGLGQDITDVRITKRPYDYTPEELRTHCIQGQGGANGIDRIHVIAASYCKQRTVPMHEFIMLQVRDSHTGLKNFIVLERTVQTLSSLKSGASSCLVSSHELVELVSSPAYDRFCISYYGDERTLTKDRGLQPYDTVEKLSFQSEEPFQFYELMMLALSTSLARSMYKLFSAQCYWFASTVWECMSRRFPQARYVIIAPSRGQLHDLFQKATNILEINKILDHEIEKILKATAGGLLALRNEIAVLQKNILRSENFNSESECLDAQQRIEILREQIRQLESK